MIFLVGVLMLIIAFLLIYIIYIKKELSNIARQLKEYNEFATEKRIDINLIDRDIEFLAESINRHIEIAHELRIKEIKSKEMLREMIASISHDLRTPLTAIIGYIQMLKKANGEYLNKKYLEKIEMKAKDLQVMLGDFFTFSLIEDSSYDLELEYLDINEILFDTLMEFYDALDKKGIEPKVNIEEVGKIIGNKKSIVRIIENLMSNVLKYSSEEVEIRLCKNDNMVNLIVMNSLEDNKKIDTAKIFEKFYKDNDKSRTNKSTGLGLSIVKTLMEKMNGYVDAEQIDNKLYIICHWKVE